ncbi:multifunctional methyltransferase subunit TRM112-like protein [Microplitis mediator]|uniref:multifunctional methyltransferase subunit TRM112-like protein n=1 Tax=Microplitis demolitor TaxID=69319 RepID=UPI0004CD1B7B|nr:multifunctional methyltransferase subunit TRM112-like protein [Microplitis demolitor]XP_057334100.1 multifunctional methyltransferase subunit TRM112-like protein [Microplitis mediator]
MKLLTHNMLTSRGLKGVTVGYPLGIVAKDIKVADIDFNSEFIARVIPKIDWNTLWKAAHSIGHVGELPQTLIQDFENNEDFLRKVHHVLLEVEVINGDLVCPESGRKFPINDGIPNMLFNEDEV